MLDVQGICGQDAPKRKLEGRLQYCGTILVVDDDRRTHVAALHVARRLGYDITSFETGDGLFDGLEKPALAILEVELAGGTTGLELLGELHDRFGEDVPVILVSAKRTDALDRVAGLLLGADDYLAKPFETGELFARVRRSLRRSRGSSTNGKGNAGADLSLSPREREILSLLAGGKSQAEIASTLVISPKTVATHIQHVLSKLGVHSRAQAVATAFQLGLVEADVRAHVLDGELALAD
jgi:DNA-binding NarL/FixJ family response regulator